MTIVHTLNVDPHFERAFPEACAAIGCEPLDLLGVIWSESGGNPAAHNRNPLTKRVRVPDPDHEGETMLKDVATTDEERYNAVGVIQFMPATLRGLGWNRGHEAFKHLSFTQQLPYVVAYYTPWQKDGAPWDSAGRLYQATFLPATLRKLKAPSDVLAARHGFLGWAYEANATFDADRDGRITIQELTDAIFRACKGARWTEILGRLGIEKPVHDLSDGIDSILDVQEALSRLGYETGPLDGYDGPRTRQGVKAFQSDHALDVDGIPGPITRRALALSLATAA